MNARRYFRIAILILSVSGLVSVLMWIDPCGYFTVMPKGFSGNGWNEIKMGDCKEKVLKSIGTPFMKTEISRSSEIGEIWYYSTKKSYNLLFKDFRIYIGRDGKVLHKTIRLSEDCKVSKFKSEQVKESYTLDKEIKVFHSATLRNEAEGSSWDIE